ncbi:MAG: transcription-repair coupling factor [Vampirovibrionales bacterium]|nr:transcription-repair coupling factor [Vampirovibrionales bacterium]
MPSTSSPNSSPEPLVPKTTTPVIIETAEINGNTGKTVSQWLLQRFKQNPVLEQLTERCQNLKSADGMEAYVDNVGNPSLKALLLAGLFNTLHRPLVVCCSEPAHVHKLASELGLYLPEDAILAYPVETHSPYDQTGLPLHALRDHYAVLERLSDVNSLPYILLLPPKALLLKTLTYAAACKQQLTLTAGNDYAPDALVADLMAMGYVRNSLILEPGEFSLRGDILDIYPVNTDPVRVAFFGDTVENMRLIDIERQRSVATIQTVNLLPRHAATVTPAAKARLLDKLTEGLQTHCERLDAVDADALAGGVQQFMAALELPILPDGIDYVAPLLSDNPEEDFQPLLEAIPTQAVLFLEDWAMLSNNLTGLSDRLEREYRDGMTKGRVLDVNMAWHITDTTALNRLKERIPRRILLDAFPLGSDGQLGLEQLKDLFPLNYQGAARFKANLPDALEVFRQHRRDGIQVLVTSQHPQRVLDACKDAEVPALYWADTAEAPPPATGLEIIISKQGPHEGFVLPDCELAHYTDTELFGHSQKRAHVSSKSKRHRDDIDVINSVNDLKAGDFVVHIKHGIGQFKQLTQLSVEGETREYLTVQYSGTDRLHVPVDQVNLLSRYRGAGEAPPKLNKMGGTDWNRLKSKAQKAIVSIARELIELYARRAKAKGHQFDPDSPWQVEMEEAFPYSETPDQWQAITDMKADMEGDGPMDRLICGDVGFGKTEVALRGIFKAVLSGKQAAVLVPTTILAQQHYNTLVERFKPYPVRIGLLSRFRSPKDQKEVVRKLGLGEIDVIVGTHRLLQKDIKFKDLGLLVIDEEQRFGVTHKEKIKQVRAEIDVLTLSATPIPRTLYMSLSGVREMSLIKTPPTNRLPIQTFVGPYNPAQVRMAILQELDRGGQVFFLHNRVQTIYQMAEHLETLIPEAKVKVAHGQMTGDDLENAMLSFAEHEYDVLLCTTIIESGLDIPNVNTIVVDQANKFGLAQLYQIRGRVGRSDRQAYCYCYYEPDRMLTTDAQDRLRALREFTTLGSGYQIALRDLEIRGVGNILGGEQHGHMVAIGFDLYCSMLEDTISQLKGETTAKHEPAIIDLNVTALIPQDWVGDLDVKLSEYKRLADVTSEMQLDHIQGEWRDRFGPVPKETQQLVRLVQLRLLATEMGIPIVRSDDEYLRIGAPFTLQEWMYLQKHLPDEIGRKARWMPGVKSQQGSHALLLVKTQRMDGDDMVDYLMTLFKGIQGIRNQLAAKAAAASS